MNKKIKWGIVFSVLMLWTLALGVDKREMLQRPVINSVSALTFEQAKPITFFNEDTMKTVTEKEMEQLLIWSDFNITKAYYPRWDSENVEFELYKVKVIWTRQNIRKDVCSIGKFLRLHPEIIRAYPKLDDYSLHCTRGSRNAVVSGVSLS